MFCDFHSFKKQKIKFPIRPSHLNKQKSKRNVVLHRKERNPLVTLSMLHFTSFHSAPPHAPSNKHNELILQLITMLICIIKIPFMSFLFSSSRKSRGELILHFIDCGLSCGLSCGLCRGFLHLLSHRSKSILHSSCSLSHASTEERMEEKRSRGGKKR